MTKHIEFDEIVGFSRIFNAGTAFLLLRLVLLLIAKSRRNAIKTPPNTAKNAATECNKRRNSKHNGSHCCKSYRRQGTSLALKKNRLASVLLFNRYNKAGGETSKASDRLRLFGAQLDNSSL